MRILLTGGAGFIGSNLAESLLKRGHELTILDNFNDYYNSSIKEANILAVSRFGEFDLWRQDLMQRESLARLFRERKPEVIIHLAAYAGVRASVENPSLFMDVNVAGTAHLLELSRIHEVQHFVFGSSSSVYGVSSQVPFREDDVANQPVSPYAVSKRAGELLCYTYHHNFGLPLTCLRFFTVYGPRQRPEMAIHRFTKLINQGEELPVYHQGESRRDYTYVDDIVRGILAAVDRPSEFEIFNLGNSKTIVLRELIEVIEKHLEQRARLRFLPAQTGDVPLTCADISKAREKLGYKPTTDIGEGVAKFVRWYLDRQEGGA